MKSFKEFFKSSTPSNPSKEHRIADAKKAEDEKKQWDRMQAYQS